jgi:hypothetical protein
MELYGQYNQEQMICLKIFFALKVRTFLMLFLDPISYCIFSARFLLFFVVCVFSLRPCAACVIGLVAVVQHVNLLKPSGNFTYDQV